EPADPRPPPASRGGGRQDLLLVRRRRGRRGHTRTPSVDPAGEARTGLPRHGGYPTAGGPLLPRGHLFQVLLHVGQRLVNGLGLGGRGVRVLLDRRGRVAVVHHAGTGPGGAQRLLQRRQVRELLQQRAVLVQLRVDRGQRVRLHVLPGVLRVAEPLDEV